MADRRRRGRGRPVLGADLVDGLAGGSEGARAKLKLILRTLAGESTVEEACASLGVGRSMFNKLRGAFLAGALPLLEPQKPGRKPRPPDPDAPAEVERLRRENEQLRLQLKAREIREEIALVMPHLLKDATHADRVKKTPPDRRRRGTSSR